MSVATSLSRSPAQRIDKLGIVVALIAVAGLYLQPFALFRANRIIAATAQPIWTSLPTAEAAGTAAALTIAAILLLFRTDLAIRLAASLGAILLLALMAGRAGYFLTPEGNTYARVSPGGGFWIMLFAYMIAMADAFVRLRLSPLARIGVLAAVAAVVAAILLLGLWDALSILREYENRAAAFWREMRTHLLLACGSVGAATLVGIPLGILCNRSQMARAPLMNSLNVLQTIPSIALFGLLIAPLGWIGANVPGASAIGIAGIGAAPALVALFAYALLPVVSNTVAGLDGVPAGARDAAKGVGMTSWQSLAQVELPLAFPVILTGIRVVLVQNIGLAVIAALIGGGGLGVFVFQGISQTATDLVLLGALPVVAMAFAAAIVLDALVELSSRTRSQETKT